MKKILLILDYRNQFYSSSTHRGASLNWEKLIKLLVDKGHHVDVVRFQNVDLFKDYSDYFVLYQSSEDPELYYKNYIEDILLGIQLQGGTLIPDFYKFRAHHNKVFMEILCRNFRVSKPTNNKIFSRSFGTFEELKSSSERYQFPVILKPSEGSRSKDVKKVKNYRELIKQARALSSSYSLKNFTFLLRALVRGGIFLPISNNRKKFIIQSYIPYLQSDYKILVYGDKFYVINRKNRDADFRASGSGKLSFPKSLPEGLLDYAENVFNSFNTPFISMDVGIIGKYFFLFEVQFVAFGQYALESSNYYFIKKSNKWCLIEEKSVLEEVFAKTIHEYINIIN